MSTTETTPLSLRHVDDQPRHVDWSEGYADTWDFVEATECDECGTLTTVTAGECEECGENVDYAEGPMMNYFYPCDIDDTHDAVRKLADLPLCVVWFQDTDETGLALTGGGMDLSWEIAAAYVRLGFAPPTHFADLPRMAGGPGVGQEEGRQVVEAMTRSLEAQRDHAVYALERLATVLDS